MTKKRKPVDPARERGEAAKAEARAKAEAAAWESFYRARGYYTDSVRPRCLVGQLVRNPRGRPFYID